MQQVNVGCGWCGKLAGARENVLGTEKAIISLIQIITKFTTLLAERRYMDLFYANWYCYFAWVSAAKNPCVYYWSVNDKSVSFGHMLASDLTQFNIVFDRSLYFIIVIKMVDDSWSKKLALRLSSACLFLSLSSLSSPSLFFFSFPGFILKSKCHLQTIVQIL